MLTKGNCCKVSPLSSDCTHLLLQASPPSVRYSLPRESLWNTQTLVSYELMINIKRLFKATGLFSTGCNHLALAHRALTSFSLMSSHLLSWSICLSRSLMSPMVDRQDRLAVSPSHETREYSYCRTNSVSLCNPNTDTCKQTHTHTPDEETWRGGGTNLGTETC